MEQAFRDKHGVGLNEYQQSPELIVKVEEEREKEYNKEQELVARLDRQVHRNDIG